MQTTSKQNEHGEICTCVGRQTVKRSSEETKKVHDRQVGWGRDTVDRSAKHRTVGLYLSYRFLSLLICSRTVICLESVLRVNCGYTCIVFLWDVPTASSLTELWMDTATAHSMDSAKEENFWALSCSTKSHRTEITFSNHECHHNSNTAINSQTSSAELQQGKTPSFRTLLS